MSPSLCVLASGWSISGQKYPESRPRGLHLDPDDHRLVDATAAGSLTAGPVCTMQAMRGRIAPLPTLVMAILLAACGAADSATSAPSSSMASPSAALASELASLAPGSAASSRSPEASPPDELAELAPGSEAIVAVDALFLREEPGLTGRVVATMARGEVMYLMGPPFVVEADGYVWRLGGYRSGYDAWPMNPDGRWSSGWAAASNADGTALLAPAAVTCPTVPIELDVLLTMVEWERATCLGTQEITVQGRVVTGFGGFAFGTFEPAWLAHPFGFSGAIGTDEAYLFYREPEGGPSPAHGQLLRITGHFNDSAAETCHIAPGDPPVSQPDSLAVMACRGVFVATSVVPLED